MKILSDCSGPCIACKGAGGCLAGHGDDDFMPLEKSVARMIIKTGYHTLWERLLTDDEIIGLADHFNMKNEITL